MMLFSLKGTCDERNILFATMMLFHNHTKKVLFAMFLKIVACNPNFFSPTSQMSEKGSWQHCLSVLVVEGSVNLYSKTFWFRKV